MSAPMSLRESYLIQRLELPWKTASNPFSFGGGLMNGGLNKEALNLLDGIFTFDYMGAAEFEFGEVPKALNKIANTELAVTTYTFNEAQVRKVTTWDRKRSELPLKPDPTVYILCPKGWEGEVTSRILDIARGRARLKEQTRLDEALRPDPDHPRRVQGWLEISNGYFFFTDWVMFEKTAALFGLQVKPVEQAG